MFNNIFAEEAFTKRGEPNIFKIAKNTFLSPFKFWLYSLMFWKYRKIKTEEQYTCLLRR